MMLKNLVNTLKHSGFWAGFVLNPYHWEFKFSNTNDMGKTIALNVGPVWFRLAISNGVQ
jgi:hypothetical protein